MKLLFTPHFLPFCSSHDRHFAYAKLPQNLHLRKPLLRKGMVIFMLKIKTNLFESVVACVFFPSIGVFFTTFLLILSLFFDSNMVFSKSIWISYIACLLLLILSLSICFITNKRSKKELILYEDRFEYMQHSYLMSEICSCKYYVCKWYTIPIAFLYKQQVAGLFEMKLTQNKTIQLKIFYKDYLKLKEKIPNIATK